ncbi:MULTISPECIES: hypothetical protein, partial [unclassified Nitrosospira]|uniref:hypothetical protein n=1 Tax=unclassified Nitrosospira TaxID=2609267 RepID=UPI001C40A0C1
MSDTTDPLSLRPLSSTQPGLPNTVVTGVVQFSVVIPTLNEADNIDPLLARLCELGLPPESFEII